jgi:hypothetical protein
MFFSEVTYSQAACLFRFSLTTTTFYQVTLDTTASRFFANILSNCLAPHDDNRGFPEYMTSDSMQRNPGLDTLQSAKQRHLLDTIDRLRNCGLHSELSLPQLVVYEDQSSGMILAVTRGKD